MEEERLGTSAAIVRAGLNRRGFLGTAIAAGGALAVAACGGASSTSSGDAIPAPSKTTPDPNATSATAITEQRVRQAVGALDGMAKDLMRSTGVPGLAVAVVHNDKVVYAKGFGVRKVGTGQAVNTDTVFELASVSKSVSASVVAGAIGQKVVSWSDPVVAHLPGFALSDPYVTQHVTIGDLFSHRSGLPDHAGDLMEDLGYDQATIIQRLRYYPLDRFRDSYAYTNFGLTAAALAVAAAKNLNFQDLCQQVVFGPLGMTSTSTLYADYQAHGNKAALHVRPGLTSGPWEAKYTRDADAQAPAGGISSSIKDMALWMRLILGSGTFQGKDLLDADALQQSHTPQIVSSRPAKPVDRAGSYGFGSNVSVDETGRVRFSHAGAFASGASTSVVFLPAAKLGIVALTNGMPVGVPDALGVSFMDIVELGKVQQDWQPFLWDKVFKSFYINPSPLAGKTPPASPTPARSSSAYTGIYANDLYGPATITASSGGNLALELGPKPTVFPLKHWDGDTYSYEPTGENALGITGVVFAIGSGGIARSVDIGNFNGANPLTKDLGTFVRT
ncbi:MAG: serine hydrolase [Candidatus Dormibacteraceae bacterium]